MIDLFGIRSRQEVLNHLNKIKKLEDKITEKDRIIQIQQEKIRALQFRLPFGSDIDYPGSIRR